MPQVLGNRIVLRTTELEKKEKDVTYCATGNFLNDLRQVTVILEKPV